MTNKEVIQSLLEVLPWIAKFFDFANKYKIEFYGISIFLIAVGIYLTIYLFLDIIVDIKNIIKTKKMQKRKMDIITTNNKKRKKKQKK